MPDKPLLFCRHIGCDQLVTGGGYCPDHKLEHDQRRKAQDAVHDRRRGSSTARGYDTRWRKYSRAFLRRPENLECRLRLPGCTIFAQCVDHIDPPDGPRDPRFWDKTNHQAACIHCNSVKGHRKMEGAKPDLF